MSHIPYGYKIKNGVAIIDEAKATNIRKLYEHYLFGLALTVAAKEAGIETYHCTAGKILRNVYYLGDEYYPAIIDRLTFDAAEVERHKRAKKLGRIREPMQQEKVAISTAFHIGSVKSQYSNPFQQAEYVYSQIESEVKFSDTK